MFFDDDNHRPSNHKTIDRHISSRKIELHAYAGSWLIRCLCEAERQTTETVCSLNWGRSRMNLAESELSQADLDVHRRTVVDCRRQAC